MGSLAFQNLMDHEFSDAERDEIKRIVCEDKDVSGIHDLRTRKSGATRHIDFHLVCCPWIRFVSLVLLFSPLQVVTNWSMCVYLLRSDFMFSRRGWGPHSGEGHHNRSAT